MIYLVLDAFIEKTKLKYRLFFKIEITLLALTIVFLILSCIIHIAFAIGTGVTLGSFFVILVKQDNRKRKEVQQRFTEYEKTLNKLADILRSLVFSNKNNIVENWYSECRIKYLISMCDNLLNKNSGNRNKYVPFLKSSLFAIVGFVAGVFAEKAPLEINLAIGFMASVVVIMIYCFSEINQILNNVLFKSDSSVEITKLKEALMDLLLRDFPESDSLNIETIENA